MGALHEDQYTFLNISCLILLGMRNVSDQSSRENQNTDFMLNNFFFENRAIYEIMQKNTAELGRPQITIWHKHIACWIPKAINTLSENVIHITFLLQQWLHKCALV